MDASGQASRAVDRATMDWAEPQPAHGTGPLPQPAGGTRPDAHTLGCILDEIDYGTELVVSTEYPTGAPPATAVVAPGPVELPGRCVWVLKVLRRP